MKKGFTLMELLVYVGIFAIAAGLLTGVLFTVLRVQQRESSSVEVTQQLNFVMQTIQRLVKESSVIIVNSTSTDVDNDAIIGTSQARLVLRMKDSGANPTTDRDPIIIWKDDATNIIKISQGTSPNQKNSDLTNNRVIADNLAFTKFTQYPGHDTVSVDMQLTYNSENPQSRVSRSLRSAIARVSAATFDSNLLPGAAGGFEIGQNGSAWSRAYLGDGTVGSPSYTFGNDTSLGIFKVAGTSTIGFSTQGLERMRISDIGYVGIGAVPTYPLDVRYEFAKTNTTWRNVFRLGSNDATNPLTLQFAMLGAATQSERKAMIQVAEEGIANAGTLSLQPNGGNVGIGTTAPGAKLEIFRPASVGDSDIPTLRLQHQGRRTYEFGTYYDGTLRIKDVDSGAQRVTLDSSGNVGIGTTTPAMKLSVDGGDNSFAWGGDHSNAGYIRIGNMQICWGNGSATNPTQPYYIAYSNFTFPSGCVFNNTTYSIIANPIAVSDNGKAFTQFSTNRGVAGAYISFHKISDASQEESTATGNMPFTWQAIGTWQ